MGKWSIDLATELAEGFALDPCGIPIDVLSKLEIPKTGRRLHPRQTMNRSDELLFPVISSAYLACGAHSGDPLVIRRTVQELLGRGIFIGAHPAYPDIFDFGQHRIDLSKGELVSVILYQFGALQAVLRGFGESIRSVKCHGALYFDVASDDQIADAMAEAISTFDPAIAIVLPSGAKTISVFQKHDLQIVQEAFADRGYDASGQIVPRSHPQALLSDPQAVAQRIVDVVKNGVIQTVDGTSVKLVADTFCLHSDTPGAGDMVASVRDALARENITIAPPSH